jgi:LmbE family N-acetylglucosaminyl deacetylase
MKILALAPHPDDIELSCGGSLNKLIKEGNEVFYVVFSPCSKSLPEGFEPMALYNELEESAKCLGIDKKNIIKLNFPVREFPKYRQEILEELVKIRKEIEPDLIFLPNSNDLHQDHKTIFEEGIRAFKNKKILGYELLWNNDNFRSNFFIKVTKANLTTKKKALKAFKSQSFRGYFDDEFLFGLARVRGVQCGSQYAEAFELIRWDI